MADCAEEHVEQVRAAEESLLSEDQAAFASAGRPPRSQPPWRMLVIGVNIVAIGLIYLAAAALDVPIAGSSTPATAGMSPRQVVELASSTQTASTDKEASSESSGQKKKKHTELTTNSSKKKAGERSLDDSKHNGCKGRPKPSDDEVDAPPAVESSGTVQLWQQCGGSNYDGDPLCKTGLMCVAKPIKGLKDYKQCQPNPDYTCQNAEGNTDLKCYYKVTWDMTTGITSRPEMYHGLTAESTFAEFQEQNFNFLPDKSECPAPCAPGTCFEVLANEGCDSFNEWACEKNDRSLAFDCCCRKYHPNVTKKWDVMLAQRKKEKPVSPSLFCIALVLPRSYEVDLMRGQFERGLGIFDPACDAWAVISNESISMNCESTKEKYDTIVMNGTLEVERGGDFNSALNTEVFQRFWDRVLEDGRAWKYDWVVKVDPDTLLFPERLKDMVNSGAGPFGEKEAPGGMYINNCFLGMHGPIEMFNKGALGNYKDGKKSCNEGEPGKKGQEDFYLRECFKMLGVSKVDAFNILLEGENACKEKPSAQGSPAQPPCFAKEAAFHPFKDIRSMMRCWAEAVSHDVSGDMAPVADGPSPENGRHAG